MKIVSSKDQLQLSLVTDYHNSAIFNSYQNNYPLLQTSQCLWHRWKSAWAHHNTLERSYATVELYYLSREAWIWRLCIRHSVKMVVSHQTQPVVGEKYKKLSFLMFSLAAVSWIYNCNGRVFNANAWHSNTGILKWQWGTLSIIALEWQYFNTNAQYSKPGMLKCSWGNLFVIVLEYQ